MKKSGTLLVIILIGFKAFSQTLPFTPADIKRMMDTLLSQSKYVFVGKYLGSQPYLNASGNGVYTSTKVEIKSVLKGQLQPTDVEVITDGGLIGDMNFTATDQIDIQSEYFVLFGNDNYSEDAPGAWNNLNNKGIRILDVIGFENYSILHPAKGSGNLFFATQDLFDYLLINYGLVNTYVIGSKPANPNIVGNNNLSMNYNNYQKFLDLTKLKSENSKNNGLNKSSASGNPTLNLTFANIQETGTSPRFLEFDILANSVSGTSYFDNALIKLSYNVAAFGTSVVANSNITVTPVAPFNIPTYFNPSTAMIDATSATVSIPFGTTSNTQIALNRVQLTTTPQPMLHVIMEIAYCNNLATIDYTDISFTPLFSFFALTANASVINVTGYDDTFYGTGLSPVLCQININDFTQPIHAGVGDILTIKGTNFGASRGNGKVSFFNADGGPAINGLNAIDYISWTDTQIRIRLPQKVDSLIGSNAPGGGNFKVYSAAGGVGTSNLNLAGKPFEIYYAILNNNRVINNVHVKLKANLKDDNGLGGYTIRLNPNDFPYNSIARGCIIKAIQEWRCYTGANIRIGEDTILTYIPNTSDGVNYVFMRTAGWAPGEAGRTVNADNVCTSSSNNMFAVKQEFDIMFNANFNNWFYDTTAVPLPNGTVDFHGVALHEFGHAIGLGHVSNSTNELMYWTGSGLAVGGRQYLFPSTSPTDGGQFSVVSSVSAIISNTCGNTVHVPQNSFICAKPPTTSLSNVNKDLSEFKIFPNPTSSEHLSITYTLYQPANITFRLIDITGQEIIRFHPENSNVGAHTEEINLPNIASGIYVLLTEINGKSNAVKVIKE